MRRVFALALLLTLWGCTRTVIIQAGPRPSPSVSPSPSPSPRPPAYTPPPATHQVSYVVKGAPESGTITYENSTGDSEQKSNVKLPWTYAPAGFVVTEGDGSFVYVSAQNAGGGTIICEILWDGQVVKTGRSTGLYSICTASGRA